MKPAVKTGCLWGFAIILLLLAVACGVYSYFRGKAAPWPEPPNPPVDLTFPHTALKPDEIPLDNGYSALLEFGATLGYQPNWFEIQRECDAYRDGRFSPPPTNFPTLVQLGKVAPELLDLWSTAANGPAWPDVVYYSFDEHVREIQAFITHQSAMRMFEGDMKGLQKLLADSLTVSTRYAQIPTGYYLNRGFMGTIQTVSFFKSPKLLEQLSDAELKQWQTNFLDAAKVRSKTADILRYEYQSVPEMMPEVFESPPSFGQYHTIEIPRVFLKPLGSDLDTTTKNIGVIYQHLIAGIDDPSRSGIAEQFARDINANSTYWLGDDPVGRQWVKMEIGLAEALEQRDAIRRTMLHGAALMVAIDRYAKKKDVLPSTLNDLVPEILPELPLDFLSETPFIYKPNPDETYLLYSRGPDRLDGGGVQDSDLIIRSREHYPTKVAP